MMSSNSVRILSLLIFTAFVMNFVNYLYCTVYYRNISKPVLTVTEVDHGNGLQQLRSQPTALLGKIIGASKMATTSPRVLASSQSTSVEYDTTTDLATTSSMVVILMTLAHSVVPLETKENSTDWSSSFHLTIKQ